MASAFGWENNQDYVKGLSKIWNIITFFFILFPFFHYLENEWFNL